MVLATKGHLKDLPPKEYGIDLKNNFSPTYTWLKGKKTLFSAIKKTAKSSQNIYIASDPDREGEMIAEHIFHEIGTVKGKINRIRLTEINKTELKKAIAEPGEIDGRLVLSQLCRRLIDRIFGFEISPVLWRDLKISGLSAGRVQSAVLKWICDRELEIRNFIAEAYVDLEAIIGFKGKQIVLNYELTEKEKKLDAKSAYEILRKYNITNSGETPKGLAFCLKKMEKKDYKNFPLAPFTTASLQESAAKSLGFSASTTMRLAQSLFEGKKINGEMIGLITYMRTDSTRIAEDRGDRIRNYLKKHKPNLKFGAARKTKSKLHSQEAHEAISPTNPENSPSQISKFLSKDESLLYELIWDRTLMSFLEPETGVEIKYEFEAKNELWITKQRIGNNLGFKAFNGKFILPSDDLDGIRIGDFVECLKISAEEKKTSPKERYTEGQIISKMEKSGIGRPSTYSQTIETLKKRKYIIEIKKKIGATGLGEKVNRYLVTGYSELIGEDFTRDMESELDDLAAGKGNHLEILEKFYQNVKNLKSKKVVFADKNTEAISLLAKQNSMVKKVSSQETSVCPACNKGNVKSKFSKNGKTIYFCSRYPHCDFVSYEPVSKI